MHNITKAANLVRSIPYATIATSDISAKPWNTPVFYAYDTKLNIYWSSHPSSQHSQNITVNPNVFIVLYNSTSLSADGLYLEALAEEIIDRTEIIKALDLLGNRREKPFQYIENFSPPGPQRIYKATPRQVWVNDAIKDSNGDFLRDYRIQINIMNLCQELAKKA